MYDAASHREDLFRRCQKLLTRYLQRYWYRAVQAGGSLGDLYVTVEEISAELEAGELSPPMEFPDPEEIERQLRRLRRAESTRRKGASELPAHRLEHEAQLDEAALEILLVLVTLQSAPGLMRACTFAWADFSMKQPTAGFLIELLADDGAHRSALQRALAPEAPLRALRLIALAEDRRWAPATPLLQKPAYVPAAVCQFMAGQPVTSDEYALGVAQLLTEGPPLDTLVLNDPQRVEFLLRALARGENLAPVALIGEPGSGRRTAALTVAAAEGRPLFVVDLGLLPWELEPFEAQLAAALRDGLLNGAVVFLRCSCFTDRADRRPQTLGRLLASMRVPVAVGIDPFTAANLLPALPGPRIVTIEDAPAADRGRLYKRLVGLHHFEIAPDRLTHLVDTYRLRPGDLNRALVDVRESGAGTRLEVKAFDAAARRQIQSNLMSLATPITTSQSLSDLIVEEELRGQIDELLDHARHRSRVFEEWGFAQKLGTKGQGLSCLFAGPPGTGKTMTAALIAKELGLDIYQVDLSRIVDKYVGETEKNLGRLFDEASRVPVVLLFDEADSLFASRTKVESSNDRYANLEVNFLLQRMETYEGISVLTTNLGTGIDQAFKRRLRFRLHFELPGPDEREILWRSMVPPGLELDSEIDWRYLAKRWEMSGAIIRNAMVRAAFLAAARGERLSDALLRQAARSELHELGRLAG